MLEGYSVVSSSGSSHSSLPSAAGGGTCDSAAGGGAGSAAGSNSNCSAGRRDPAAATCAPACSAAGAPASFTGGSPAAACANSNWSEGRCGASAIAALLGAAAAGTWLLAPSSHSLEAAPLRRLTSSCAWARASKSAVGSGGAAGGGLGSVPSRLYAFQAAVFFRSLRVVIHGNRDMNSAKVALCTGIFSLFCFLSSIAAARASSCITGGGERTAWEGGTDGPGFGPFACCGGPLAGGGGGGGGAFDGGGGGRGALGGVGGGGGGERSCAATTLAGGGGGATD